MNATKPAKRCSRLNAEVELPTVVEYRIQPKTKKSDPIAAAGGVNPGRTNCHVPNTTTTTQTSPSRAPETETIVVSRQQRGTTTLAAASFSFFSQSINGLRGLCYSRQRGSPVRIKARRQQQNNRSLAHSPRATQTAFGP